MSTEETNCIEEFCQDCTRSCCQSCTDSCTANCQDSCNQACSDACSNACSESCSGATCSCGSSTDTIFLPYLFTLGCALVTSIFLGIFQAFNSQGPIIMTIFGSVILAFNLTGIRIHRPNQQFSCNRMKNISRNSLSTKFGWFSINHSHHPPHLITAGHEFQFKKKFFCTGCYGILLGTAISIILGSVYLINGFDQQIISLIPLILPLTFLPITLRYLLPFKFPSNFKLIANSLLPIGCSLMLVYSDILFQNWVFNMSCVFLILTAAFLRSLVAQRRNNQKKII